MLPKTLKLKDKKLNEDSGIGWAKGELEPPKKKPNNLLTKTMQAARKAHLKDKQALGENSAEETRLNELGYKHGKEGRPPEQPKNRHYMYGHHIGKNDAIRDSKGHSKATHEYKWSSLGHVVSPKINESYDKLKHLVSHGDIKVDKLGKHPDGSVVLVHRPSKQYHTPYVSWISNDLHHHGIHHSVEDSGTLNGGQDHYVKIKLHEDFGASTAAVAGIATAAAAQWALKKLHKKLTAKPKPKERKEPHLGWKKEKPKSEPERTESPKKKKTSGFKEGDRVVVNGKHRGHYVGAYDGHHIVHVDNNKNPSLFDKHSHIIKEETMESKTIALLQSIIAEKRALTESGFDWKKTEYHRGYTASVEGRSKDSHGYEKGSESEKIFHKGYAAHQEEKNEYDRDLRLRSRNGQLGSGMSFRG